MAEVPPQAAAPPRTGLTRELVTLAWPGAMTLLLNNVYGFNDQFWVKFLGRERQAAVADASMVTILSFAVYEGVALGVLALASRAHGAGHPFRARQVLRLALGLSAAAALLVGLTGLATLALWIPPILPLKEGVDAAALAIERAALAAYMRPLFYGAFFLCLAPVVDNCFLAQKDSRTPLKLQLLAVCANTLLNPLLIFGLGPVPALGTAGAGLASVSSRALSTTLGLFLLNRRLPRSGLPDPRSVRARVALILKIGSPATAAIGLYSGVYLAMWNLVFPPYGALGRAAFGNGFRIEGLAFCLIWGIGMASGSLAGRYLGAGRADLARGVVQRAAWVVTLVTIPPTLLFLLLPDPLAAAVAPDAGVRAEIVVYLRVIALSQFAVGLQGVFDQSLSSAGYSLPVFFSTGFWNLSRIPLSLLLGAPDLFGLPGIWWAVNLSTYGKAATSYWLVRRGRWLRTGL